MVSPSRDVATKNIGTYIMFQREIKLILITNINYLCMLISTNFVKILN